MDILATDDQIIALSPPEFLRWMLELSSGGNGRKQVKHSVLLKLVSNALARAPDSDPFRQCLACLHCLGRGQFTPAQQNSLGHLLLAAVDECKQAPSFAQFDLSPSRKEAAALVSSAFQGAFTLESRLVVRVAATFGVKSSDLEPLGRESAGDFAKKLVAEKSFAAGMGLAQQLDLGPEIGGGLLLQMIDGGAAQAAMNWAKPYGKEVGGRIVRELAGRGDHKLAWQLIEKLGMQEEFPGAYIEYRKTSITKLAKKGLWDVARALAEEDPILKEHCVEAAIIYEDFAMAVEFADRFGLDHLLTEDVIAASGLPPPTDCLTLPIPANRIFFIDTPEGLASAQKEVCASNLVGIDCEWKADSVRGATPNPVALLQLATRGGAWLVDLIALEATCPASLESFLSSFLSNENILKLGFAVNGDFDRISKTHAAVRGALQNCGPVLDLSGLAKLRGIGTRSLSGICEVCIGKPLSKRVRMSNWEQRPLSEAQTHYAALDALCLIPLFDLLSNPEFRIPEKAPVSGGSAAGEGPGVVDASFRTGSFEGTALAGAASGSNLGQKEGRTVGLADGEQVGVNGAAGREPEPGSAARSGRGLAGGLVNKLDSGLGSGLDQGIGRDLNRVLGGERDPNVAADPAEEAGVDTALLPSQGAPLWSSSEPSTESEDVQLLASGNGRRPPKPWQSLVYFYGARIDGGRAEKRQKKRKQQTAEVEETETVDAQELLAAGTGALGSDMEPTAGAKAESPLMEGHEPQAAGFAEEKVRETGRGVKGEKWGGLGLPERVAEALQKGGVTPPQVLVCWEGEGRTLEGGTSELGGTPNASKAGSGETEEKTGVVEKERTEEGVLVGLSPDQPLRREGATVTAAKEERRSQEGVVGEGGRNGTLQMEELEEIRALEEWRAAKRAAGVATKARDGETREGEKGAEDSGREGDGSQGEGTGGQVSGGELAHVATRERPAWQVRCIPVLISVLEDARNVRPTAASSLGEDQDESSPEGPVPPVQSSKKRRLKPVVVLIEEERTPDLQTVVKHLGMPGKYAWIANGSECLTYFGYPSALLPPTGHLKRALVAFDSKLRSQLGKAGARLVTASGAEGVTIAWEIGPLVRLTGATSRDFGVRDGAGIAGETEDSGEEGGTGNESGGQIAGEKGDLEGSVEGAETAESAEEAIGDCLEDGTTAGDPSESASLAKEASRKAETGPFDEASDTDGVTFDDGSAAAVAADIVGESIEVENPGAGILEVNCAASVAQSFEAGSIDEELPVEPWYSPREPKHVSELVEEEGVFAPDARTGLEGGLENGVHIPRRRFRRQRKAPPVKSPRAGTGPFVGLSTRKELEKLARVLGGPARGTRNLSTGLGGRPGLEKNGSRQPSEKRSVIDVRSSFCDAWAAEAERKKPFWEGFFSGARASARYDPPGPNCRPSLGLGGGQSFHHCGWRLMDEEKRTADLRLASTDTQQGNDLAQPPRARLACWASVTRPSSRTCYMSWHRLLPGPILLPTFRGRFARSGSSQGHIRTSWAAALSQS